MSNRLSIETQCDFVSIFKELLAFGFWTLEFVMGISYPAFLGMGWSRGHV